MFSSVATTIPLYWRYGLAHTEKDLSELANILLQLDGEVRVIMEATGVYHLPILMYLKDHGFFVSVVNPYEKKKYRSQALRLVKTDKQDQLQFAKGVT